MTDGCGNWLYCGVCPTPTPVPAVPKCDLCVFPYVYGVEFWEGQGKEVVFGKKNVIRQIAIVHYSVNGVSKLYYNGNQVLLGVGGPNDPAVIPYPMGGFPVMEGDTMKLVPSTGGGILILFLDSHEGVSTVVQ